VPIICPYISAWLPLGAFLQKFDIEGFYKNLFRKSKFDENQTTGSGTVCVTATGNNKM
jgi:hypothetical protein